MKINHIISSFSPLIFIVGSNCININLANAATLSFSYTFGSDEEISGSFDGEILSDDNKVENLSNLEATYSGAPNVIFDTVGSGSFFTLDRSEFSLFGSSNNPEDFFSLVRVVNGPEDIQVVVSSLGIVDSDTTIDNNNLTLEAVDVDNVATPEPGITLALAFLSSFGCWQKLKKKQVSSS